jgi:hypothetical protein
MPRRCSTIDNVDAVRNGTELDIGESTGEYNIESGTMLVAPECRVLAQIV